MARRIVLIDAHPDEDPARLIHALATAYADGAAEQGHPVRRLNIAELDFPLLQSIHDWHGDYIANDIHRAQDAIRWADHLALFYPLWLGDMPALLKGFLEQVMRPGFAIDETAAPRAAGLLKGKSARIVVTMGMPAAVYRYHYGAHSLRSLERNIFRFVGIAPVHHTLFGNVDASASARDTWLDEMRQLGAAGG